jgi:ring-1,2-phenylacetyl-CoA epoxidase subunit PaaC
MNAEASADRVYEGLADQHVGDVHWAFGTGFQDAGVEVTAPIPTGVDRADLAEYCLMLGDDALVASHRLAEWVSNAPELEEEVALANIALDLLGQARALLGRAGHVEGAGRDEDRLAYWRAESEFRNVALAELDTAQGGNGDFSQVIAQLLVFATWRLALLHRLRGSADPVLAAVASKGVNELAYHRDYAARWTLRLGDGTEESHRRMAAALDWVWPHVEELFRVSDTERRLVAAGVAVDPAQTRAEVDGVLDEVLRRATPRRPERPAAGPVGGRAGRQGVHTEPLGHLLAEMQSLARQHPEATW